MPKDEFHRGRGGQATEIRLIHIEANADQCAAEDSSSQAILDQYTGNLSISDQDVVRPFDSNPVDPLILEEPDEDQAHLA